MRIIISIKNTDIILKKLNILGDGIKDLSKELKNIGSDIISFTDQVFKSRGQRLLGNTWQPLNKEYAKSKDKIRYGTSTQILILTGKMKNSFRDISSSNLLKIYNTAEYFAKHQLGEGKIPQRMMIGINDAVANMIKKEIANGIKDKLNKISI